MSCDENKPGAEYDWFNLKSNWSRLERQPVEPELRETAIEILDDMITDMQLKARGLKNGKRY